MSCSDVNTTLNSYLTESIIIMLKMYLVEVEVTRISYCNDSKMTQVIFVVWLQISHCLEQNSVPAVMMRLLGSKATNRAERSEILQLYLQRKFLCSKNALLNNQNIGEFSLYQQLVLTQITVLFLCYLLLNNCRNCGDICWVYEWKVKTMSMCVWQLCQRSGNLWICKSLNEVCGIPTADRWSSSVSY